ncbi:C-C chemokine receptor type 9-like [Astyanax mexicanus]|uniref:C-C chemokine receptor type 9-like n=1 Tax=Astyanax mexicanus TaxID=7994 RepID=UPI0020CB58F3|nr:C-C chemokine receptor type 9-like [Astyanax mexicanus]
MMSLNRNTASLNGSQVTDEFFYSWCQNAAVASLFWTGFGVPCFLLGFPASVMALYELLQRQRQKVANDMFMISLAFIDLAFTASIPFFLCNYIIWRNVLIEWISYFIYSFIMVGRPLFMACVCGDCHVAVIYPIAYKTNKKLLVIKKIICIILWFIIMGFGIVLSSIYWIIISPISSVLLLVSLPVIFYCDISVLLALRKTGPGGNGSIHPQKKQAIHTILTSFIMSFIAYLPPTIILSFGNMLLTENERLCSSMFYGACFSMAGSVIMPILYLNSVGKFDTFKKWWKP